MARLLESKCKRCRRMGEKLFLKGERCYTPKCAVMRRKYAPGMHGQGKHSMLSEYGIHLREKQKAKLLYGILERQFKKYFQIASRNKTETGKMLLKLLESRLDSVVYALGLAPSRQGARSLVSHGHIFVNNRSVDVPSFQVQVKDVIEVRKSAIKKKYFQDLMHKIKPELTPTWLKMDAKTLKGEVVSEPPVAELTKKIDTQLIVEYYSK